MKFYYDLHIHSALSPCGDMDMTPNNIVNMSVLKGLDIIAVSDHNSVGNVRAVMKVAEDKPITVVPAMEIETLEEVHVLCLFPDVESAESAEAELKAKFTSVINRPEIFGEQAYMNSKDEITGYEDHLLVTATNLSIDDVKELADRNGGVAIPAHVDRSSYSVLSNLGVLPDIGFCTVEVSKKSSPDSYNYLRKKIIQNSDAHYLWDISERENSFELPQCNAEALIKYLKE
ncbi:MAG: phosphoesterase [Clostridia bacterium]|nr:phosphoesterase [Clostridia bacterium]